MIPKWPKSNPRGSRYTPKDLNRVFRKNSKINEKLRISSVLDVKQNTHLCMQKKIWYETSVFAYFLTTLPSGIQPAHPLKKLLQIERQYKFTPDLDKKLEFLPKFVCTAGDLNQKKLKFL